MVKTKVDENVCCPFCGQRVKGETLKNLSLNKINHTIMPILAKQGLEIRKKKTATKKLPIVHIPEEGK